MQNGHSLHTIQAELDNTEKYLYIQKARFQARLQYTINVPEHPFLPYPQYGAAACGGKMRCCMGFRPNATVERWISTQKTMARRSRFCGGQRQWFPKEVLKRLRDKDSTVGSEMGLRITDRRIKQYYGEDYGLEVVKSDYSGSTVSITISKSLISR